MSSAGSNSATRCDQDRPDHAVEALADDRPRGHVDEDGAEQRERDADAAEDEIFPRRLDRLVRAIDADHQHRRQGRQLDRHPHQADVVGHQREVHARTSGPDTSHDRSAGAAGVSRPDLDLMGDVARAEHAGGEADESVEHDEDDVEFVDPKIGAVAGRRRRTASRRRRGSPRLRRHVERAPTAGSPGSAASTAARDERKRSSDGRRRRAAASSPAAPEPVQRRDVHRRRTAHGCGTGRRR